MERAADLFIYGPASRRYVHSHFVPADRKRFGLFAATVGELEAEPALRRALAGATGERRIPLSVLVTLARIYLAVLFRRASSSIGAVSTWRTSFFAGSVAAGLVWGSSALLLYAPESTMHQVFLAFVLGGMVVGAAAALTPISLAFALSQRVRCCH